MNETFLFIFASIGMTHIIIDGSIFESLRIWIKTNLPQKIAQLFQCYMCLGFWCGVFIGINLFREGLPFYFACGCAGSILSQFTAIVFNALEAATIKLTSNLKD
jgi:hypothetical protein